MNLGRLAIISSIFLLISSNSGFSQKVEDGTENNLTAQQRSYLRKVLGTILPAPSQARLFKLEFSRVNAYCGYVKQLQAGGDYGPMQYFWIHPGIGKYNVVTMNESFNAQMEVYLEYCSSQ